MTSRSSKSNGISNHQNRTSSLHGHIIGDFKIGSKLGQGTFSKVCVGTHMPTGEKVAIKIMSKDQIKEKSDKIRIEKEINIQKKLHHQNIIQQYAIMDTETTIYIISEYCSGGELFDYIVSKRKLYETEACRIYQQLISGLEYLHKQRICHRDLKPENLLFDYKHNLKIADFGLSNDYHKGKLSTPCGSPCYAAPEMVTGKKYSGSSVDIWSSGIVLYTMVCGFLPFEDDNQNILFGKIAKGLFSLPSFLSSSCKDLLKKILVTDPKKRYGFEEIKHHPWFMSVNNMYGKNIFFNSPGVFLEEDVIPIDVEIVAEIYNSFHFDINRIIGDILRNRHNKITTTYYLILKRKIRNNENSVSDISSNSNAFIKYINSSISKMAFWNNDYEKITDYYVSLVKKFLNTISEEESLSVDSHTKNKNNQKNVPNTSNISNNNNKESVYEKTEVPKLNFNELNMTNNNNNNNNNSNENNFPNYTECGGNVNIINNNINNKNGFSPLLNRNPHNTNLTNLNNLNNNLQQKSRQDPNETNQQNGGIQIMINTVYEDKTDINEMNDKEKNTNKYNINETLSDEKNNNNNNNNNYYQNNSTLKKDGSLSEFNKNNYELDSDEPTIKKINDSYKPKMTMQEFLQTDYNNTKPDNNSNSNNNSNNINNNQFTRNSIEGEKNNKFHDRSINHPLKSEESTTVDNPNNYCGSEQKDQAPNVKTTLFTDMNDLSSGNSNNNKNPLYKIEEDKKEKEKNNINNYNKNNNRILSNPNINNNKNNNYNEDILNNANNLNQNENTNNLYRNSFPINKNYKNNYINNNFRNNNNSMNNNKSNKINNIYNNIEQNNNINKFSEHSSNSNISNNYKNQTKNSNRNSNKKIDSISNNYNNFNNKTSNNNNNNKKDKLNQVIQNNNESKLNGLNDKHDNYSNNNNSNNNNNNNSSKNITKKNSNHNYLNKSNNSSNNKIIKSKEKLIDNTNINNNNNNNNNIDQNKYVLNVVSLPYNNQIYKKLTTYTEKQEKISKFINKKTSSMPKNQKDEHKHGGDPEMLNIELENGKFFYNKAKIKGKNRNSQEHNSIPNKNSGLNLSTTQSNANGLNEISYIQKNNNLNNNNLMINNDVEMSYIKKRHKPKSIDENISKNNRIYKEMKINSVYGGGYLFKPKDSKENMDLYQKYNSKKKCFYKDILCDKKYYEEANNDPFKNKRNNKFQKTGMNKIKKNNILGNNNNNNTNTNNSMNMNINNNNNLFHNTTNSNSNNNNKINKEKEKEKDKDNPSNNNSSNYSNVMLNKYFNNISHNYKLHEHNSFEISKNIKPKKLNHSSIINSNNKYIETCTNNSTTTTNNNNNNSNNNNNNNLMNYNNNYYKLNKRMKFYFRNGNILDQNTLGNNNNYNIRLFYLGCEKNNSNQRNNNFRRGGDNIKSNSVDLKSNNTNMSNNQDNNYYNISSKNNSKKYKFSTKRGFHLNTSVIKERSPPKLYTSFFYEKGGIIKNHQGHNVNRTIESSSNNNDNNINSSNINRSEDNRYFSFKTNESNNNHNYNHSRGNHHINKYIFPLHKRYNFSQEPERKKKDNEFMDIFSPYGKGNSFIFPNLKKCCNKSNKPSLNFEHSNYLPYKKNMNNNNNIFILKHFITNSNNYNNKDKEKEKEINDNKNNNNNNGNNNANMVIYCRKSFDKIKESVEKIIGNKTNVIKQSNTLVKHLECKFKEGPNNITFLLNISRDFDTKDSFIISPSLVKGNLYAFKLILDKIKNKLM